MSEHWPRTGALLASRYLLVELLETGGMAEIWRARDEVLEREVALKLPTQLRARPESLHLAWREAKMAAKLSHPNIAAVHDYGEAIHADGSVTPFVVMELLPGDSLATRVERSPLTWREAAAVAMPVADALAAAHAAGVIHRDIKPGNVMLTPTGVKILDFGISAVLGEPDDDTTGMTFGTPAYVAPERLDGRPAEPATDVYGLGVLLFEMVTGDPPYPVETWEELAVARAVGPADLPAGLPRRFRDLVARCLAEEPRARPTAAEARRALASLIPAGDETPADDDDAPGFPTNVAPAHGSAAAVSDGEAEQRRSEPRRTGPAATPRHVGRYAAGRAAANTVALHQPVRRRRVLTGTGMAAALLAVAGIVLAVNTGRETPGAAPTTSPVTTATPDQPVPLLTTAAAPSPSSAPPSSRRSTPPVLDFDDAIARARSAVEAGRDQGRIRGDVATDLLNLLANLQSADDAEVGDRVAEVRQKVRERVNEGSVAEAQGAVLQARLADVNRAAGA